MKAVRDTSAACYREHIKPTLYKREWLVLEVLRQWHGAAPTSYELTDALRANGLVQDVNGVRPRITALVDKGLIEPGDKRRCRITGRTAYTWKVVQPRVEREPEAQRLSF